MAANTREPENKDTEIEVEPKETRESKGKEDKSGLSETIESLKQNENVKGLLEYAQNNTQDTIAYILLIVGIIWAAFFSWVGGILIGLVAGFYFSKEIVKLIKSYNEFIEQQGTARSLILGGTALALFIAAPGIFVGAAIMVGLKVMLRAD